MIRIITRKDFGSRCHIGPRSRVVILTELYHIPPQDICCSVWPSLIGFVEWNWRWVACVPLPASWPFLPDWQQVHNYSGHSSWKNGLNPTASRKDPRQSLMSRVNAWIDWCPSTFKRLDRTPPTQPKTWLFIYWGGASCLHLTYRLRLNKVPD